MPRMSARFRLWVITPIILTYASFDAYGQTGAMRSEFEYLYVLFRDASTKKLVADVDISSRRYTMDGKERAGGASGHTDDGTVQLGLGSGKYQFVIQAEGYHPLVLKECVNRSSKAEGISISLSTNPLRFFEKVFLYTVYLEPCQGRDPQWRFQSFLSDSIYYNEPQAVPEPIGGVQALKKRIGPSILGGRFRNDGSASMAWACTSIEKDGRVSHVEMSGQVPRRILEKIADGVKETRFKPAMILGNPVRSKVWIPFEIALKWQDG